MSEVPLYGSVFPRRAVYASNPLYDKKWGFVNKECIIMAVIRFCFTLFFIQFGSFFWHTHPGPTGPSKGT